MIEAGETFERIVTFGEAEARAFAAGVGDLNPMHHDAAFAAGTRFGGLIVSGTQSTAVMLGMTANFIAARAPALGLECRFAFKRAIRMGETVRFFWTVIAVEDKPGFGRLVDMEGTAAIVGGAEDGRIALTGWSRGVALEQAL